MDQSRDAQPRCRGSSSLCALGRVGGWCGSAKRPSAGHRRTEGPAPALRAAGSHPALTERRDALLWV